MLLFVLSLLCYVYKYIYIYMFLKVVNVFTHIEMCLNVFFSYVCLRHLLFYTH